MLAFTNAKEKQSPTIIGAGCKLTGDMKTDHTVQIHGQVIGNITADTVVIGRGGRVVGNSCHQFIFTRDTGRSCHGKHRKCIQQRPNDRHIILFYIEYNQQYWPGMQTV